MANALIFTLKTRLVNCSLKQREYFRTCINQERYKLNLLVKLINITEGRYTLKYLKKVTEERE